MISAPSFTRPATGPNWWSFRVKLDFGPDADAFSGRFYLELEALPHFPEGYSVRFLPYLLVLAMAAPVFAWVLIDMLVIKGTSTTFAGSDLWVMLSLGVVMLLAFGLLATWMDRFIHRTRG